MREKIRLLLLQIRNDGDPMRAHEHECFLNVTDLASEQIVPIDAVTEDFRRVRMADYDGLLVGGSGEYSWAKSKDPFLFVLKDFISELIEKDFPIFASCFGFHTIAVALGGEVVTDPDNMEVGTFELELFEAGAQDQLFDHLEPRFLVQMGHKDHLSTIPEGVDVLARGAVIDCQALRVRGKRTWATQFHPELTATTNRERYLHYFSQYPGEEPDSVILDSFRESKPSNDLINRFIDTVL